MVEKREDRGSERIYVFRMFFREMGEGCTCERVRKRAAIMVQVKYVKGDFVGTGVKDYGYLMR